MRCRPGVVTVSRRRRAPHRPGCRHCPRVRLLGLEYRGWRHARELELEHASCGYAAEAAELTSTAPLPTFRDYLVAMAGSGWPMSGRAPRRHLEAVAA